MGSSRTNKQFRNSFKATSSKEGGFTSKVIKLENTEKKQDEEAVIRRKIQIKIKEMVSDRNQVEYIKKVLSSEEKYNKYEQFFDVWIQDSILNTDSKLKMMLERGVTYNKSEEEILEKIEQLNSEVYDAYKEQIIVRLKDEINKRELKNKKQEEER